MLIPHTPRHVTPGNAKRTLVRKHGEAKEIPSLFFGVGWCAKSVANEFQERELSTRWRKGERERERRHTQATKSTNLQRNLINRSQCLPKTFLLMFQQIHILYYIKCVGYVYLFSWFEIFRWFRLHPVRGFAPGIFAPPFSRSPLLAQTRQRAGQKIQFLNKFYSNSTIFVLFIFHFAVHWEKLFHFQPSREMKQIF